MTKPFTIHFNGIAYQITFKKKYWETIIWKPPGIPNSEFNNYLGTAVDARYFADQHHCDGWFEAFANDDRVEPAMDKLERYMTAEDFVHFNIWR